MKVAENTTVISPVNTLLERTDRMKDFEDRRLNSEKQWDMISMKQSLLQSRWTGIKGKESIGIQRNGVTTFCYTTLNAFEGSVVRPSVF